MIIWHILLLCLDWNHDTMKKTLQIQKDYKMSLLIPAGLTHLTALQRWGIMSLFWLSSLGFQEPLCKFHFLHSRQLQLKPRKTRQWVLRPSAFKSKLLHLLLLIKDFDSVLLLWNRDGKFMAQLPTPAHLVPTQQWGCCSFLQRIFLTSVNQAPATKRFKYP